MAKLKQVIQSINSSSEQEEVVKEALSILMSLTEEKVKGFIAEIITDLFDNNLQGNSGVPITRIISKYEEYRAFLENTDKDSVFRNIVEQMRFIFSGNPNITTAIANILYFNLELIISSAAGEDSTRKIFLVVPEYPIIVRYDFTLWNRTMYSKGIRSYIKNALGVAVVKSSVDISKLDFKDFLSLYGPILREAFGDDKNAILNMINEAKNIYNSFMADIPASQANNVLQNTINLSDDKLIEYILQANDIFKIK